MKVVRLGVTQVSLVKFDEIPLHKLVLRKCSEQLASLFQFNQIEIGENPLGQSIVVCHQGMYNSDSGDYPIKRLEIQERKILYNIDGPSEMANEFFASLTNFLADLAETTNETFLTPIVKADESEIVTHLDFSAEALFSPVYWQFIKSTVVSKTSSEIADTSIQPALLSFQVEYFVKDKTISEYSININKKDFTVSPRPGSPLSEQIYYSKAPVDTNTHMELLRQLEHIITENGK
jgi:hypothetical protein